MSALPIDAAPAGVLTAAEIAADPALRRGLATLRAGRRLDLGPCGPIALGPTPALRIVHQCGEGEGVPFPPSLRPLLRRENPARHWALILDRVFGRHAGRIDNSERQRILHRMAALLAENTADDGVADDVCLLVPVTPCAWCRRPFLREWPRRVHCSDRCRREASYGR